jgi:hypothetical protein
MTSNAQSDLSLLFAAEPAARWEAAHTFAPAMADERLARVKEAIRRGNVGTLTQPDIDPLSDLPEALRPLVEDWGKHFALFGALNAWLVFVGPSPGQVPPPNGFDKLLGITPYHRNPMLGWPHPTYWFPGNRGLIPTLRDSWIREILAGIVPDMTEEAALSSALLVNLTHGYFPNAADVEALDAAVGARRFWTSVVSVTRPRLVIALTRTGSRANPSVYQQLLDNLPSGANADLQAPRPFPGYQPLPWSVIRCHDWSYPVLLATVPQHPSRVSFLGPDLSPLHSYLRETARRARGLANLPEVDAVWNTYQPSQSTEQKTAPRTANPVGQPRTAWSAVKSSERPIRPGIVTAANLWSVLRAHGITASNKIRCPAGSGVATITAWHGVPLAEVARVLVSAGFTVMQDGGTLSVTP